MASSPKYMTPQGFENLREEYRELLNVERPKTVEVVAWAASNGDRSENADYIYGKRRLREIDRRIKFLKDTIQDAEVVDPKTIKETKKIVFGATVTIEDEDGVERTYQIVGEHETDLKTGKISWKSPVAKSLLGKSLDDEVKINRPAGTIYVTVTNLEYK